MKKYKNNISSLYSLLFIIIMAFCHGQAAFSQEKKEKMHSQTKLMEDSVIIPQVFIKNRSLVDIIDSISRIKWQETGKYPQDYIMQFFMVRDTLVVYTGWISLKWLIDGMLSRDDDIFNITTVFYTKQKGKVIGFLGYNNCNFYIVDTGIPIELRNSILDVSDVTRLTLRPYEPLKEWNGMKVYDVNVHRGTALYMLLNGKFVECEIERSN